MRLSFTHSRKFFAQVFCNSAHVQRIFSTQLEWGLNRKEEAMLKTHIAACLLTTALITAPALAQTNPAPNANQPVGRTQASQGASQGQVLTQASPDQWRSSKLVGLTVYGPNNERIGEINEVLVDRNGKVDAVVIGVGGFLGIGEKDVA